ncbi:hypothetical protein DYB32_001126 [Aphanomyces invadans]|uniref:Uncharacterized protein n=1 Tax=Aphanomyces invadans TaxID=157072 RepID=A0A3R6WSP6_9STRA|nr:hypothetical protein DYB32_001126 [Aphanomyces invadans]
MTCMGLGNGLPVLDINDVRPVPSATTAPILGNIIRRNKELTQKRTTDSAQALKASLAALEALASPPPLDLAKAHPSLLRRTSSMLKAKKAMDQCTKKPKTASKNNENIVYKDGKKVYIPLESEIEDEEVLKVLGPRRRQVEVSMCSHLQGKHVTLYSVKRDRFVSEEALGELRGAIH